MDLDEFSVEDLLLAAIMSEIESSNVYNKLADTVSNAFLKDRLRFLAEEEVKHQTFLEGVFKRTLPGKDIVLPDVSPVPLPFILVDEKSVMVSEVMEKAMVAEKVAHDFYMMMAERFDDTDLRKKLQYLAKMEMGHYRLLELEMESMRELEDYIVHWPMMHSGP
jgi:rubrerythrin